jgi:hypothetical protein
MYEDSLDEIITREKKFKTVDQNISDDDVSEEEEYGVITESKDIEKKVKRLEKRMVVILDLIRLVLFASHTKMPFRTSNKANSKEQIKDITLSRVGIYIMMYFIFKFKISIKRGKEYEYNSLEVFSKKLSKFIGRKKNYSKSALSEALSYLDQNKLIVYHNSKSDSSVSTRSKKDPLKNEEITIRVLSEEEYKKLYKTLVKD